MGRPRYVKDDKTVELVTNFASLGMRHDIMAYALKITTKTLRKYYRDELNIGLAQGHANCLGRLRICVDRFEPWAIALYMRLIMGMTDEQVIKTQQLGADGKPINPGPTYVIKGEDLKQIEQDLEEKV